MTVATVPENVALTDRLQETLLMEAARAAFTGLPAREVTRARLSND